MISPTFKDNFIKYLLKLVPDNINQEFNFEVTEYKTGYIRLHKNELESVYLICRPKKDSELQGEIFIKYKFRNFHYVKPGFKFDKIYFRPDGCNEYRYDKDLNIDAIYLRGVSILPGLDPFTKKHYFEILKEWEKADKTLKENNEYISVYQTTKDKEKVKIAYVVCSDRFGKKAKRIRTRVKKIIDSITNNFIIEDCLYGCKGTFENGKVIKSDPIYLTIYSKNAEEINEKLKKKDSSYPWNTESEFYDLHSKEIFSEFPFYHTSMIGDNPDDFANYIIETAGIKSDSSVIDLGCGSGYMVNKLQEQGCYSLGISTSKECIKQSKLNYPDSNFEIGNMETYNSKPISHFISLESLSYSDIKKTFKNIYNNLKDKGIFYIKDWVKSNEKNKEIELNRKKHEEYFKYKLHTLSEIIEAAIDAGFELKFKRNLLKLSNSKMYMETIKYHKYNVDNLNIQSLPQIEADDTWTEAPFELIFIKNKI